MVDGWKEVKLEEVVDKLGDGLHGTPKYDEDGEYYFINGNNLNGRIEINEKTKTVSDSEYRKHYRELNDRTILISINGTLGRVAVYNNEKVILGKSACYFNVKSDYSKDFIKYVMHSSLFKEYLNSHSTGTTIKNMGLKQMREFTFNIPPLKEQKAIAHILSTLDEKIEVNNKINKTLEKMAQEIFKHWFVDFEFPNEDGEPYKSSGGELVESELGLIPKGWEKRTLGEVIDFIKDTTKPGNKLKGLKYNPIDTIPMKSITLLDSKPYSEAKSSLILFNENDILIGAMRVYFHRVVLSPYNGITRSTTFVLRSKKQNDLSYNLFLMNLDETIDYASSTSKGSTMPYAVWENGLNTMEIAYPIEKLRSSFNRIVYPMLEYMKKNAEEIRVLTELRDTLLPKLMSGEIRVPLNNEEQ